MKLIDERTADGSRCFARLPNTDDWEEIRQSLLALRDLELTLIPQLSKRHGMLGFRFRGHEFRATRYEGELCLVVCDPLCSDLLLCQVVHHLEQSSATDS